MDVEVLLDQGRELMPLVFRSRLVRAVQALGLSGQLSGDRVVDVHAEFFAESPDCRAIVCMDPHRAFVSGYLDIGAPVHHYPLLASFGLQALDFSALGDVFIGAIRGIRLLPVATPGHKGLKALDLSPGRLG